MVLSLSNTDTGPIPEIARSTSERPVLILHREGDVKRRFEFKDQLVGGLEEFFTDGNPPGPEVIVGV